MAEKTTVPEKIKAVLTYVTAPSDVQLYRFRDFLKKEYPGCEIEIELKEDASISNGFILETRDNVYDYSARGRSMRLKERLDEIVLADNAGRYDEEEASGQNAAGSAKGSSTAKAQNKNGTDPEKKPLISPKLVMTMISEGAKTFNEFSKGKEVGRVLSVGDGIVKALGLNHAMYGEIVVFEDGTKGMVQNIEADATGIILFGDDAGVFQGSRVTRTGKMAGIPTGEAFLGRVVDALGNPIDGKGEIAASDYRAVEEPAPAIIDRKPVTRPLETGILAIDSMFPIGRGQRELIIGDRQTGKTSIAMDAIMNQKGKDCLCIYVAIGQKASTIASLNRTLQQYGAMEYTIIVAATAADSAPLQYIAPYAGASLAEYFMHKGRDVLIIYDDLSKHAVAYRALSLLLGRSPGREAYPGDVFYLHSRLLERSSQLSDEKGGGSMTALPIVETQDGDVSAYIPTNVISITDGQIFLESDLFFEGQRPAVNVGLSVSRVGGAAQTKAMKKAAGSLRIDLAQYREMAVFTQFSSDLDETTANQLKQGRVLMELLKQPLGHPLDQVDQVILLVAAVGKKLMDEDPGKLQEIKSQLLAYFHKNESALLGRIEMSGKLEEADREQILSAVDRFKESGSV